MLVVPVLALLAAAPAVAVDTVKITEFPVPYENSRPRDPYVDARGRVWFVGQAGNYIAYFDQSSGQFKRYELDPGVHPHNLIVDQQGMVWYAGNRAAHIGKLDPATGKITKYMMPDSAARDPHTLVFDSRDNIWFSLQGANMVGRLNMTTGKVDLVKMTAGADSRLLEGSLDSGAVGIVVEALGRGNVPEAAIPGIRRWVEAGKPVVVTSRSLRGRVLDTYAYAGGGHQLREMGVIFGDHLTGQQARIELMLALGAFGNDLEAIRTGVEGGRYDR